MNTKQVVYQVLLALGAVAVFFGIGQLTGITDYLIANLDVLWASVATIVGIVMGLIGIVNHKTELAATAVGSDVKSTIGQVLVALGAVAVFLGLTKFSEVINYLLSNLDTVWAVGLTLVGFVAGLIGLIKGKTKEA